MSTSNDHHSKPARRRSDSDELDIFEAARYFSGVDLVDGYGHRRGMRDEHPTAWKAEKSSNKPMRPPTILPQQSQKVGGCTDQSSRCKQPSSPSSKLASFLNSLFHQTGSKKKSKSHPSMDEGKERHSGGRNRRSSSSSRSIISHSESIRSSGSRIAYSNENSGFRASKPYPKTPPDQHSWKPKPGAVLAQGSKSTDGLLGKSNKDVGRGIRLHGSEFMGGKFTVCSDGFVQNIRVLNRKGVEFLKEEKGAHQVWGDNEFRSMGREAEEDNSGESESSSDLFELKNYNDLGDERSELPVYGTTDLETINREGAASKLH